MDVFTASRDISQVKTAPAHPAANNVETVMKPLGKAMKIGHSNQIAEKETLNNFLVGYRDTPHISTGVSPGAMIFRDGYRSNFPRTKLEQSSIDAARRNDALAKQTRKEVFNSSRRTRNSNFREGDYVLVRNYKKTSKFDPIDM